MALADFFPRDTIAISQVLKGFQPGFPIWLWYFYPSE